MSGMFDPDTFLDSYTEEANDTERTLIPAEVYPAYIEDVAIRHGDRDDGSPWVQLVVKYVLESPEVAALLNREEAKLTDSFFIDLDDDGKIATGTNKNIKLGKLRKAVGKNSGRFSPRDLSGCRLMIAVKHVTNKDSGNVREEVASFASAQ